MVARWAHSCLRGRRGGRLKMVVRKLKAAIYECVLAHSLCNAVTSTGPCGTPFRRWADSVLAQSAGSCLSCLDGRPGEFARASFCARRVGIRLAWRLPAATSRRLGQSMRDLIAALLSS